MTMTDPIADMLARLRNAHSAYHDTVAMPHSKIKANLAEILKREGYIASWGVEDAEGGVTVTTTMTIRNAKTNTEFTQSTVETRAAKKAHQPKPKEEPKPEPAEAKLKRSVI
mgnify:CR=1 FL=1